MKPNILFLADTSHPAGAVHDHINAITQNKLISWHVVNPLTCKTIDKIDFGFFDAIGIHYSIKIYNNYYLSSKLKRKIAEYSGTKFVFLQDEYQRVNETQDLLINLGITLLFTLVDQKMVGKAYPNPGLNRMKTITVLTGYVSEYMKTITSPDIRSRPIDVSYRGRRCDYWLGSLAYEKQYIAERFYAEVKNRGIITDISIEENDRLYGTAWYELLQNSKAVLGTESGASVWDFDRSVENKTKAFLRNNRHAEFSEVYDSVLKPHDGQIMYNAISPRVFEAAATKTPMIMFPGEYNNVCVADKHYIPLAKDFSNIETVLAKIKDTDYLQQMADVTYHDLIASNLYSQFELSRQVSDEILKMIRNKNYQSEAFVSENIRLTLEKNQKANKWLLALTELHFMISNFLILFFDNKYSFKTRLRRVVQGMKRYITYLSSRLKKNRFT